MKLIYLREHNLKDNILVRDVIINFKLNDKVLLIHDPFANSLKDTRFVTRRLSSLFSESMVYNNAFMADQRGFFTIKEQKLEVNTSLIEKLLQTVQLLIIGPIISQEGNSVLASTSDMIHAAIQQLSIDEVILFPNNPKSPLVTQKVPICTQEDKEKFLRLYEEEKEVIEMAHLFDASLASPMNYAK